MQSTQHNERQAPRRHSVNDAVTVVLGLPGFEAEENIEEDSNQPLIHGAENEDEYEPNYSVQEGSTLTQVKAISFHQACCLPGVIPVRTVQISLPQPVSYFSWR